MYYTNRLILRPFKSSDKKEFAKINSDPDVMKFFPKALLKKESDSAIDKLKTEWINKGISFSAIVFKENNSLIGMSGLQSIENILETKTVKLVGNHNVTKRFENALEIGWRLANAYWGKGIATEASKFWLKYGFDEMGVNEIFAFSVKENIKSVKVMKRLGMKYEPEISLYDEKFKKITKYPAITYSINKKMYLGTL